MKARVVDNNTGETLMVLEYDGLYMTRSFYRFIRTMMFTHFSCCSYEYSDISAEVNGSEFFRLKTEVDGSGIKSYQYVNDVLLREIVVAE